MESYSILAILQLLARWIHVFAVMLWIGQTYLFHMMERHMTPAARQGSLGQLRMIHGGGYYEVEKRSLSPPIPEDLLWFKWEAAVTWISGFVLIGLTYHAGGLLTDPGQHVGVATSAGLGALMIGWVVYDALANSSLRESGIWFAVVSVALTALLHFGLLQVMSARSAFIHIGATLGTIMVANVWNRILPAQRRLINAAVRQEQPVAKDLAVGPTRSRHNSVMVVPLVLLMISNHYPTISYGHDASTLILSVIMILGMMIAVKVLGKK